MKRYFYLLSILSLIASQLQGMNNKVITTEIGTSKEVKQLKTIKPIVKKAVNSEEIKSKLKNLPNTFNISKLLNTDSDYTEKLVLFDKCVKLHKKRNKFLYEMVEKLQLLKETEGSRFIPVDNKKSEVIQGITIVDGAPDIVIIAGVKFYCANNKNKVETLKTIENLFKDYARGQLKFSYLQEKIKQLRKNSQANNSVKQFVDAAIYINCFNSISEQIQLDLDEPHTIMPYEFFQNYLPKLPDYGIKLDHYLDIVKAVKNCKNELMKLLYFSDTLENTLSEVKKIHPLYSLSKLKYSALQQEINKEYKKILDESEFTDDIDREKDFLKQQLSSPMLDDLIKKYGLAKKQRKNSTAIAIPGRVQYLFDNGDFANHYAIFCIDVADDGSINDRSYKTNHSFTTSVQKKYDRESDRSKTKKDCEASFKKLKNEKNGIIYEDANQVQVNDRTNNMLFTLYKWENIVKNDFANEK